MTISRKNRIETDKPLADFSILIVDNDELAVRMIRDILRIFGFSNISSVFNGRDAMRSLHENSFDIVICDWVMRPVTGIELLKFIREDPYSPNPFVPFIMVTGRADRKDVEAARDQGTTEFLVKPFTVDSMREKIVAVIDSPREFVISSAFRGPCRRRSDKGPPEGANDRRTDR